MGLATWPPGEPRSFRSSSWSTPSSAAWWASSARRPAHRHRGVRDRLEVVVFSFIITFGLIKACVNLVSGLLADRYEEDGAGGRLGRRPTGAVHARADRRGPGSSAQMCSGISQGLAWSMTVNMKIDLVGPGRRGFAMGLNEAAGYGALA